MKVDVISTEYGDIDVDYDEDSHKFFLNFQVKFDELKNMLLNFFDKDVIIKNISNMRNDFNLLPNG